MIRINLLPYREKEKKENLQQQIVIISGVVGALSADPRLRPSLFHPEHQRFGGRRFEEAEARLVVLNKKVGDIERFKRDKKELEQKLGVINSLETNRLLPVRMLDELNLLVPVKDVWLEKITQTKQDLRIEGMARNNDVVARFMKNLEKANFIQTVDLLVTMEKEVFGVKLQQFTLACVIKKGT